MRRSRSLVATGVLLMALGVAGARAELRVVGTDLLGPRFLAALDAFARETGTPVAVELRGTRSGLEALNRAGADLGLFLLPPGETVSADANFVSHAVAFQPLAVVVPRDLRLTQLTHAQVRGIFAVGADDRAATGGVAGLAGEGRSRSLAAHAPAPENFLSVAIARQLVFNGAALKPSVLLAPDLAELTRRLGADDQTIALSPAVPADGGPLRAVAVAASVRDAAFLPTAENLASGDYSLRLPLYVTFRRSSAPRLLPLLRFLLSDEGAEALAERHFLPLPVAARQRLVFELEQLR